MILILDFGSQVTQLIARRVREAGVYCEIWPFSADPEKIRQLAPRGIILSGGPASVLDDQSPRAPQVVWDLNVPILGICYGQQTMAAQLGGAVDAGKTREFGRANITIQ
ncbi:MAG: GMP synthase (glutamine-hydrolyzing), partial [Alphaproteobacteria bacterium]|nr:GMP synthase (glutamine-hydrolyzing) [Alphaproteobacteria bacterium]